MNRNNAAAFIFSALVLVSLGALGLWTQEFGWVLMLGVPYVAGMVLGRWLRLVLAVQIVCGLTLLVSVFYVVVMSSLAGVLCGVIAGVVVGGPFLFGVVLGSATYGRISDRRTVACIALVAVLLPVEGRLAPASGHEEIATEMTVPLAPVEAFDRFRFYEAAGGTPERLLTVILPQPVGTEAVPDPDRDLVRCVYEKGHLVKEITRSERGRRIEFVVVEQVGIEDRSVALTGGSVHFRALGADSTVVTLTTRYRPLLSARAIWRPFEKAVVHALHRHVVSGLSR